MTRDRGQLFHDGGGVPLVVVGRRFHEKADLTANPAQAI
jgi:hypothetical protein